MQSYLKKILVLNLVLTLLLPIHAGANTLYIPEGVYTNKETAPFCSVEVKVASKIWKTHTITVFQKSIDSKIIPDSTVKSDPFSLDKMSQQAEQANGKFLIITKKSSYKLRKISGRIFEKNNSLFWDVSVFSESCLGFCTSSAASCTVLLPY